MKSSTKSCFMTLAHTRSFANVIKFPSSKKKQFSSWSSERFPNARRFSLVKCFVEFRMPTLLRGASMSIFKNSNESFPHSSRRWWKLSGMKQFHSPSSSSCSLPRMILIRSGKTLLRLLFTVEHKLVSLRHAMEYFKLALLPLLSWKFTKIMNF